MDTTAVQLLASPLAADEKWSPAHPTPKRTPQAAAPGHESDEAATADTADTGRRSLASLLAATAGDGAAVSEPQMDDGVDGSDGHDAPDAGAGAAQPSNASQHEQRMGDLMRSAKTKAAARSTVIAPHSPFSALELTYPAQECRQWSPSPKAFALSLIQTLGSEMVQLKAVMDAPRLTAAGEVRVGMYCHEFVGEVQRLIRTVQGRQAAGLRKHSVWVPPGSTTPRPVRGGARGSIVAAARGQRGAEAPKAADETARRVSLARRVSFIADSSDEHEGGGGDTPRPGSAGTTPRPSRSANGTPRPGSAASTAGSTGSPASGRARPSLARPRMRIGFSFGSPRASPVSAPPREPASPPSPTTSPLGLAVLSPNQPELGSPPEGGGSGPNTPGGKRLFQLDGEKQSGTSLDERVRRLRDVSPNTRRSSIPTDFVLDAVLPINVSTFSTIPTPHLSARSATVQAAATVGLRERSPPASPTTPTPRTRRAQGRTFEEAMRQPKDIPPVASHSHMYTDTPHYNSILETEAEIVREWEAFAPERGSCIHSIDCLGEDRVLQHSLARLYCSANVSDKVCIDWGDLNAFLIDTTMQGNDRLTGSGDTRAFRKHVCAPLLRAEYNGLCHAGMTRALYSQALQRMVVLGMDNHCRLFDPCKLNRVIQTYPWAPSEGRTVDITMLDVPHAQGPRLATSSSDGVVRIYDLNTASLMTFETFGVSQTCVEWSSEHGVLYCGGRSGGIHCLTMQNSFLKCKIKRRAHLAQPDACVTDILPLSGNQLLAASLDPDIHIIDAFRGQTVSKFHGHQKGVHCLAYSKLFNFIASSGFESTPYLWFNTNRKGRKPFRMRCRDPHTARIAKLRMVEGTPQLLSLDEKGVMKVWDVRMMHELYTIQCSADLVGRSSYDLGTQRFVDFVYHEKTKSIITAGGSRRAEVAKAACHPDVTKGIRKANCFYRLTFESVESYFASQPNIPQPAAVRAENYPVVAVNILKLHREILTAAATHANVWDAETGALLRQFSSYTDVVTAQAVSTGEDRVFTGTIDGTVLIQAMNGLDIAKVSLHRTPVAGLLYFDPARCADGTRNDGSPMSIKAMVALHRRASKHAESVRRRTRQSTGSLYGFKSGEAGGPPLVAALEDQSTYVPSVLSWDTEGDMVCTGNVLAPHATAITETRVLGGTAKIDATCAAYCDRDGSLLVGCRRNLVCIWRQRRNAFNEYPWTLVKECQHYPPETDTSAILVLQPSVALVGNEQCRHQLYISCNTAGGFHMGRSDGLLLMQWPGHCPGDLLYPVVSQRLRYYPASQMLYAASSHGYVSVYDLGPTLNFDASTARTDPGGGREFHPVFLNVKREERVGDGDFKTARDSRDPRIPPTPQLVTYWRAHGQVSSLDVLAGVDADGSHIDTRVVVTAGGDGAVRLWSMWGRLIGVLNRLTKDPGAEFRSIEEINAWCSKEVLWRMHCELHDKLLPVPLDDLPSPEGSDDEQPNYVQRYPEGEGPHSGDLRGVLIFGDDCEADDAASDAGWRRDEPSSRRTSTRSNNGNASGNYNHNYTHNASSVGGSVTPPPGAKSPPAGPKPRPHRPLVERFTALLAARQARASSATGTSRKTSGESDAAATVRREPSAFSSLNAVRSLHLKARGLSPQLVGAPPAVEPLDLPSPVHHALRVAATALLGGLIVACAATIDVYGGGGGDAVESDADSGAPAASEVPTARQSTAGGGSSCTTPRVAPDDSDGEGDSDPAECEWGGVWAPNPDSEIPPRLLAKLRARPRSDTEPKPVGDPKAAPTSADDERDSVATAGASPVGHMSLSLLTPPEEPGWQTPLGGGSTRGGGSPVEPASAISWRSASGDGRAPHRAVSFVGSAALATPHASDIAATAHEVYGDTNTVASPATLDVSLVSDAPPTHALTLMASGGTAELDMLVSPEDAVIPPTSFATEGGGLDGAPAHSATPTAALAPAGAAAPVNASSPKDAGAWGGVVVKEGGEPVPITSPAALASPASFRTARGPRHPSTGRRDCSDDGTATGTDYFRLNYGELFKPREDGDAVLEALASSTFVPAHESRLSRMGSTVAGPAAAAVAAAAPGDIALQLAIPQLQFGRGGSRSRRASSMHAAQVEDPDYDSDLSSSQRQFCFGADTPRRSSTPQPRASVPFDDTPAPWGHELFGPMYGYPEAMDKLCSYAEFELPGTDTLGTPTTGVPVTPGRMSASQCSPTPRSFASLTPSHTLLVPPRAARRRANSRASSNPSTPGRHSPALTTRSSRRSLASAGSHCAARPEASALSLRHNLSLSPKRRRTLRGSAVRPPPSPCNQSKSSLSSLTFRAEMVKCKDKRGAVVNTAKLGGHSMFPKHVKKKPLPARLSPAQQEELDMHLRLLINTCAAGRGEGAGGGSAPECEETASASQSSEGTPPDSPQVRDAPAEEVRSVAGGEPLRRLAGLLSRDLRRFIVGVASDALAAGGDEAPPPSADGDAPPDPRRELADMVAALVAVDAPTADGSPPAPDGSPLLDRQGELRAVMWDVLVRGLSASWNVHEVSRRERDRLAIKKKRPKTRVERIHEVARYEPADHTLEFPAFDTCEHVRPARAVMASPDPDAMAGPLPATHWLARLVSLMQRVNPAMVPVRAQRALEEIQRRAQSVVGADTLAMRVAANSLALEQPTPPDASLNNVEWFDALLRTLPSPCHPPAMILDAASSLDVATSPYYPSPRGSERCSLSTNATPRTEAEVEASDMGIATEVPPPVFTRDGAGGACSPGVATSGVEATAAGSPAANRRRVRTLSRGSAVVAPPTGDPDVAQAHSPRTASDEASPLGTQRPSLSSPPIEIPTARRSPRALVVEPARTDTAETPHADTDTPSVDPTTPDTDVASPGEVSLGDVLWETPPHPTSTSTPPTDPQGPADVLLAAAANAAGAPATPPSPGVAAASNTSRSPPPSLASRVSLRVRRPQDPFLLLAEQPLKRGCEAACAAVLVVAVASWRAAAAQRDAPVKFIALRKRMRGGPATLLREFEQRAQLRMGAAIARPKGRHAGDGLATVHLPSMKRKKERENGDKAKPKAAGMPQSRTSLPSCGGD